VRFHVEDIMRSSDMSQEKRYQPALISIIRTYSTLWTALMGISKDTMSGLDDQNVLNRMEREGSGKDLVELSRASH
jgi:hypothetical protein